MYNNKATIIKNILTKFVLNDNTGELEAQDFMEIKEVKKRLKGGFRMIYKEYDEILKKCVKSNLDLRMILEIRDKFTYKRIEVYLSAIELAKTLGTTRQTMSNMIKKLLKEKFILKVDKYIFRLNPFMYLPYRCKAIELQQEWIELDKDYFKEQKKRSCQKMLKKINEDAQRKKEV